MSAARQTGTKDLLYTDSDWDFDTLKRTYDAIEDIALQDLGLNLYPNQIEIILTSSGKSKRIPSDNEGDWITING